MTITILKYAGALVLGVLLGLISLYLMMGPLRSGATVTNGVWTTDLSTGSAAAGPYTRAQIALYGLLALNRSETVYYFANNDADGAPLTSLCDYAIEGRDPDARWWSLTVYGPDSYLLDEAKGRYSASATSVTRRADGTFRVVLAGSGTKEADAPGAIPTGTGAFNVTLRLYNPGRSIVEHPDNVALPRLIKGACR